MSCSHSRHEGCSKCGPQHTQKHTFIYLFILESKIHHFATRVLLIFQFLALVKTFGHTWLCMPTFRILEYFRTDGNILTYSGWFRSCLGQPLSRMSVKHLSLSGLCAGWEESLTKPSHPSFIWSLKRTVGSFFAFWLQATTM